MRLLNLNQIDSLERGMVRLQEAMEARREEFEAEKLSLVSLLVRHWLATHLVLITIMMILKLNCVPGRI